jgi:hypothetical protein
MACWFELNLGLSGLVEDDGDEFVPEVVVFDPPDPPDSSFSLSVSPQNDNKKKISPNESNDFIDNASGS